MNKIYYDGFEIINSDALNDRRQLKKIDSVIMFATDRYLTMKTIKHHRGIPASTLCRFINDGTLESISPDLYFKARDTIDFHKKIRGKITLTEARIRGL